MLKIVVPHTGTEINTGSSETELLLDESYRIVERNSHSLNLNGSTLAWGVSTIDSKNNVFAYLDDGTDDGKPDDFYRASYMSGDGILFGGFVFRPRRSDQGNENIIDRIYETHPIIFLKFQTLIPLALFARTDILQTEMPSSSINPLITGMRGHAPICGEGRVQSGRYLQSGVDSTPKQG